MPWATVWDNTYLPLRLSGVTRSEAAPRIEATLAAMGLDSFAQVYPRELSGGMKMRVSIARAIAAKPKLLLMDEPFAALDELARQSLNDDLLTLWREDGLTVVFVTHSVYESAYLSTRVAVMSQRPGRVADEIALEQLDARDESYRLTPAFSDAARRISAALQEKAA